MTEIQLQAMCWQHAWNHASGKLRHRIFAINNNANGSVINAMQKKASGLVAGIPDMCIICDDQKVIWIEFKSEKGKLSEQQIKIHKKFIEAKHIVYVVSSFHEFTSILESHKLLI